MTERWATPVLRAIMAIAVAQFAASATFLAQAAAPAFIPPSCQDKPITTVPQSVLWAQMLTEVKHNRPIAKAAQLEVFDALAKVIHDSYVYPDFNGLNWPAHVAQFRARVATAPDTDRFYDEMQKFVDKLGDEHSHFESPLVVGAADAALAGNNHFVGIGALSLPLPEKQRITLLAVYPGSAAEHGGLREHDSILAVDGLPMVDKGFVYPRTLGPECSAAVVRVQSPGEAPREVTLVRHPVAAPEPIIARLVPTNDGSRIGYLFLPTFYDLTIPDHVKRALVDFGPVQGLIIDNRMNGGGASRVLEQVLGYFTSGTLGYFVTRTVEQRPLQIMAQDINNSQRTPLVVLVSKHTASFGEIFSGALRDSGRAMIVGQSTAGHVEILHGHTFADGSRVWIAQERFDPLYSHRDWRKGGIRPDVEVDADWDTFRFSNDPAIAAAVKLLGHR
jgi:carboxyl-terminal processing protease